jgi:hypothetical protein
MIAINRMENTMPATAAARGVFRFARVKVSFGDMSLDQMPASRDRLRNGCAVPHAT